MPELIDSIGENHNESSLRELTSVEMNHVAGGLGIHLPDPPLVPHGHGGLDGVLHKVEREAGRAIEPVRKEANRLWHWAEDHWKDIAPTL